MVDIGVLALQGAVREHVWTLEACGCSARPVKRAQELEGLHGLVIPGGESTTIGKLMIEGGFMEAIKARAAQGMGVFGTCAGMIMLATGIEGSSQPRLALMTMLVSRNAFGRQRESFETSLDVPCLGPEPYPAVFIRAPYVLKTEGTCRALCEFDGKIVLARDRLCLVSAFHPELTRDLRLHQYFIGMLEAGETGRVGS